MAYDAHRHVVVAFGGADANDNLLSDTEEWDGSAWHQMSQSGPAPRSNAVMAYDSHRGVVILHGGEDNQGYFSDTWEWNGVSWNQIGTDGPARTRHSMVYDSNRNTLVMYGGRTDFLWGDVQESTNEMNFTAEPDDQHIVSGQPVSFHVGVTGSGNLTYQWRHNGVELIDAGNVSGSNSDTLSLARAFGADEGLYDCVVTDDSGTMLTQAARLTVTSPTLTVQASCPLGGRITISWENATPGGQIGLIYARKLGATRIPAGNSCAGTTLGLGNQSIQLVYSGSAGDQGSKTLQGSAGPNACGGYMQLLDVSSCSVSNTAVIQ